MVVYVVVHKHTVRGGGTPRMACNRDAKRPTRKSAIAHQITTSYMQGLDFSSSDGDAHDTAVAPSPPVPAGIMVCFGVRWCMVWWCAMVHGGIWCCSYTHSDPKPTFKPGPMESTAICYQLCTDVPYTHSRLGQKKSWIEHLRILKGHGQCATIANKAYKTLSR